MEIMYRIHQLLISLIIALTSLGCDSVDKQKPNIIFILSDDHRWDAIGFKDHPFLKTPHLDKMAEGGVVFENAFVTTSLCSPSRASILTGLYTHNHGVVDNYHPVSADLTFFPQMLQKGGYETAFIGKWHMGDSDEPQRGFDHWVAFRGQGSYYPDGHGTTRVVPQTSYEGYNVNGEYRKAQQKYITDELTDYALNWLDAREQNDNPFFLYISHKAVHSDFVPRDKDKGKYQHEHWELPATFQIDHDQKGKPKWLQDQRNSRHGVDYGYNLDSFNVESYYKRYCEALIAVDDNIGRVFNYLKENNLLSNTLVVYMGDNGFQFGDHGLIDKRTAYEASIRVPLLMHYPEQLMAGSAVSEMVANIDIGPTFLEAAGIKPFQKMDGESFWRLAKGDKIPWRKYLQYEYYWEWNYPQTPTIFALRGEKYKYIRYYGIWDTDELYDIENDPIEKDNLIQMPELSDVVDEMKTELFIHLRSTNGMRIPLLPDRGRQFYFRHPDKSKQGVFPGWFYEKPAPVTR
ncbi:MAG: sulfatase [Cyclobacteriaceae bacterium]|nr:sulfatase [Cyclobacteriaceae bacterium SS2]